MWQVRVIDQTITQQYNSGRTQIYVESLNLIQDNLWTGVGLGKYIFYNAQGHRYPHNLFLEVTVESGLLGLLLLMIIVSVVMWQGSSKTLRNNPYAYLSYIAFVSLLVATQFSGDIYDSRSIFLLGLMTLSHHITSDNREKGIL